MTAGTAPDLRCDGPATAPALVLAHGAGIGMDTPFMETFAAGLAERGVRVVRFEFPYMAQRRRDGKKRPPNPQGKLLESFRTVVDSLGGPGVVALGGKSMGGRMASLLAAEYEAANTPAPALVALGYPFHPPGKPDRLRTGHLHSLATPGLIVQGERDPFGTRAEVSGYGLSDALRFHWAPDGDHDLAPRKSSGHTAAANHQDAIEGVARFLHAR